MSKILLTGGAGFLGSHFTEEYVRHGHDVVILDTVEEGDTHDQVQHLDVELCAGKVLAIRGDVCDKDLVKHIIVREKITEVVHLAGISHTVSTALGQVPAYKSGFMGLATIYDVIIQLKNERRNTVKRVSVASSSLLSGMFKKQENGKVKNDDTILDLDDCYHQYCDNKLAMEMICRDNWNQFQIPFSIFRFGTQYGPRMKRNVVTWYFIRNAMLGLPLEVHGDGSQVRQHFYCKDMAKATALIMDNLEKFKNKAISIVPNYMTSVMDIAEAVKKVIPEAQIFCTEKRPIDVKVNEIEPSKELEELGWKPEYDMEAGVRETIEWYKERMDLVREGFDKRIKEVKQNE